MIMIMVMMYISVCSGFAAWFAGDSYCQRPLRAGEIIMNEIAFESPDTYLDAYVYMHSDGDNDDDNNDVGILMKRGVIRQLHSSETVQYGDKLLIHAPNIEGQYVFDVSADSDIVVNHDDKNDVIDRSVEHSLAVFENGGCGGKRVDGVNPATLQIAKHREEQSDTYIYIRVGYSTGHKAVRISTPLKLLVESPSSSSSSSTLKDHDNDDDDDDDDEEHNDKTHIANKLRGSFTSRHEDQISVISILLVCGICITFVALLRYRSRILKYVGGFRRDA